MKPDAAESGEPRHRGWYWLAMLAAIAALVSGTVVAVLGYTHTSGPDGAVKGYFEALERSDAAAALGFGDLPDGSRALLSSDVLREQQSTAAISSVTITSVVRNGPEATVGVHYVLAFADARLNVTDTVGVHASSNSWKLDEVAVPTQFDLTGAANRATVHGAPIPAGTVLLFPGAAPVRFDTGNIALDDASAIVHLNQHGNLRMNVVATPAGRAAAQAAMVAAVTACLHGAPIADPRCPLPDARAVPDSLRGKPSGAYASSLQVAVNAEDDGLFEVTGTVIVSGSYTKLDFNNIASTVRGKMRVNLDALFAVGKPSGVIWQQVAT
jgi:hypothetical protein